MSSLKKFLSQIDRNHVFVLPYNSNARKVAIHAKSQITEKYLLKHNVVREAIRIQWQFASNQNKEDIINAATEYFWNSSTPSQRNKFVKLARNANRIITFRNNEDTINRISRITTPQITNNALVNNFYGGTSFP